MFWRGRAGRLRRKGVVFWRAKRQALREQGKLSFAGIDIAGAEWASQSVRSGTGHWRPLAVSHEDLCS